MSVPFSIIFYSTAWVLDQQHEHTQLKNSQYAVTEITVLMPSLKVPHNLY